MKLNQEKTNSLNDDVIDKDKAANRVISRTVEPQAFSVKAACSKLGISHSGFYILNNLGKTKS